MTTRISGKKPRAISQKSSSMKKQMPKKYASNQAAARNFDPPVLQTQHYVDDRDGLQFYHPQNYDGSMGHSTQGMSPSLVHAQFPEVNQMGQPSHPSQQLSEPYPGPGYPVAMDHEGHYYPAGFEMMGGSGQPMHPNAYFEPELNPQMMDHYFYQYGDFGGSIAPLTEGGPSVDGEGGPYYEPMMHSGMHPGYRNYPGERGAGGYGGEDSFPGSQHQAQYMGFPYGQGPNSNYGGQDGKGQGPLGADGFDAFERDMKCPEDLMRLSTEQLLHTSMIPSLPRRDAAALIIEEQDRQGIHGTSFATEQDANLGQLGLNRHVMSSSQGFQQLREHSPEPMIASTDGPSRGGLNRLMTQIPSSKNSSTAKGNASRRSGPRENNFMANEDEIAAQEIEEEDQVPQERHTFGSQANSRQSQHQRQQSKQWHDEPSKDLHGPSQQQKQSATPIINSAKKPPKPYQSMDQSANALADQAKMPQQQQSANTSQVSIQPKDYRLHGDSPRRQQMQLERARENSLKSKHSQQASMSAQEEQLLNESRDKDAARVERPHKRIDLRNSQLNQHSQHQYPNTARSLANNAAAISPIHTAGLSMRSQQQSRLTSAERRLEMQQQHQTDAHSPNFNYDREGSRTANPFAEKLSTKISISDQEQHQQNDSPISLNQVGGRQVPGAMMMQPVEETAAKGLIMSQQNRLAESQSQNGNAVVRPDQNRSMDSGLKTDRSLRESALMNPQIQDGKPTNQPGQVRDTDGRRRRPSRNNQMNQDHVNSHASNGPTAQITVTPFSNEDLNVNELSGGGSQPTRLQRARTVMIKQPSSGETASQFHDNDSPKYGKLSQPPRDSIQSVNQATMNDNNTNSLSPQQQQHFGHSQIQQLPTNLLTHSEQHQGASQKSLRSSTQQQMVAQRPTGTAEEEEPAPDAVRRDADPLVQKNTLPLHPRTPQSYGPPVGTSSPPSQGAGTNQSNNPFGQGAQEGQSLEMRQEMTIISQPELHEAQAVAQEGQTAYAQEKIGGADIAVQALGRPGEAILDPTAAVYPADMTMGAGIQQITATIQVAPVGEQSNEQRKMATGPHGNLAQMPGPEIVAAPQTVNAEHAGANAGVHEEPTQYKRTYTLGQEGEPSAALLGVNRSDLKAQRQNLSSAGERDQLGMHQRGESRQTMSPSGRSHAAAPTVQEIPVMQEQNMIFNRNADHLGNENESIFNQDISSKQSKSPQQQREQAALKRTEPQSFADYAKAQAPVAGDFMEQEAQRLQQTAVSPKGGEILGSARPDAKNSAVIQEGSSRGGIPPNMEPESRSNEKAQDFTSEPELAQSSAQKAEQVAVEPLNFRDQLPNKTAVDRPDEQDEFQESIKDEVMKSLRKDGVNEGQANGSGNTLAEQNPSDRKTTSAGYPEDGMHPQLLPPQPPLPFEKAPSMPTPSEQVLQYTQDDKSTEQQQQINRPNTLGGSFLTQSSKNDQAWPKMVTQAGVDVIEEEEHASQNQSVGQVNEIELLIQQQLSEHQEQKHFVDINFADEYTAAGESLLMQSYSETVEDEVYREAHDTKASLADRELNEWVKSTESLGAENLGTAWRLGLDKKHYSTRYLTDAGSECSSVVSMPVQEKPEAIETFDLQYILFDFDFQNLSQFGMQKSIGEKNWDEVRHTKAELAQIEKRSLVRQSGLDRQKRALELAKQSSVPIQLDYAHEDDQTDHEMGFPDMQDRGAPGFADDKYEQSSTMELLAEANAPPAMRLLLPNEPRESEQYQSENYSERMQRITEEEAHRLYKQHRLSQKQSGRLLSVHDQSASPTIRSSPRTSRKAQTLAEQKAAFKNKMNNLRAPLQPQATLLSRRAAGPRGQGSLRQIALASSPPAESMVDPAYLGKRSRSPRATTAWARIERPSAKRYSSPQANRQFGKVKRASGQKKGQKIGLKANGRARRSQSKHMQQQLDQESKDGQFNELTGEQIGGRQDRSELPERPQQKLTVSGREKKQATGIEEVIEVGDEEENKSFGGRPSDEMTVEDQSYDEEYDAAWQSSASNLFGSPSNQVKREASEFEDNSDYQQFLRDLNAHGLQVLTRHKDNSAMLGENEGVTDRARADQAEPNFRALEFFIEDSGDFWKREQDLVQRKDLKTVKPELVRINQKIVYRIDYEAIFNKIMNEEHELIHYLCQSRRHFIHLKKEHQNHLDNILFEQNCFVYFLKQSKNVKLDSNSASDAASHQVSSRPKIKTLGQLNKRIHQDVQQKNAKKPAMFKNKVNKFLFDLSIQQQDVLDIEKLLPIVQNQATASRSAANTTAPNLGANQQQFKMDKGAGGNYAGAPLRRQTVLVTPAHADRRGSLATIQEDAIENPRLLHSIDEKIERSEEAVVDGVSRNVDDLHRLQALTEDQKYEQGLKQISEVFTRQAIINKFEDQSIFLEQKYIAVFHYFSTMTSSALFENLHQNCIYYKIDQILRRVPKKYFDHIKKDNLDQWELHTRRVQKQGTNTTDNRLSIFDAGFPNLKYQFSQDYTLNIFIKRLMYQQRSVMDQIKYMIFQNKECLLIQNLHAPYLGEPRKDMRAPLCKVTGCVRDPREEFILGKFNELYYLSCEKDDTYRFNIRARAGDAEHPDQQQKKGTFYDDQPQEEPSEDSDDDTSYMVKSYVNQAVEKDPEEVSRRVGERILEDYQHHKDAKKLGGSSPAGHGRRRDSARRLRDKLRINSRLQMVHFPEAHALEDEDELAKSQKALPSLGLALLKKDESKDDQKDKNNEEPNDIINMPKKVVSRQEARAKDQATAETYPKFRLSQAFGYGQFISNENLYEVYDTKLASQADRDDLKREQKKAKREQEIQDKREQHQQAIKNLLKNNLLSRSHPQRANLRYDMHNMNEDKYEYTMVANGQRQIYLVKPKRLREAAEDKSGVMEKFINFATRKQFAINSQLMQQLTSVKEEPSPAEELSGSPVETAAVASLQAVMQNIEDPTSIDPDVLAEDQEWQQKQDQARLNMQVVLDRYGTSDGQLARRAMARLQVYRSVYVNKYEAYQELPQRNPEEHTYEVISERDSFLEVASDEPDNAFEGEAAASKMPSLAIGRQKGKSTYIPRSQDFRINLTTSSPLSPQKTPPGFGGRDPNRAFNMTVQSRQLKSLNTLSPTHKQNSMNMIDRDMAQKIGLQHSVNDTIEGEGNLALPGPFAAPDTRRSMGTIASPRGKRDQDDIYDVESDCEIDDRPDQCRQKLSHIKQVAQSSLQQQREHIREVYSVIVQLLTEKEQDELMDQGLREKVQQIKIRKQQQKERKEKVILDYQRQEETTQMQQFAIFNTTFKSIEYRECIRVQLEPIQIIKIVANRPLIYRQKDIFTPIINRKIQTQDHFVFTYNFQEVNEPKYRRRKGPGHANNQIETFIYQDEVSPLPTLEADTQEDADQVDKSKESREVQYLDKFENVSQDNSSQGQLSSSEDDLDLPVLQRVELAKERRKRAAMVRFNMQPVKQKTTRAPRTSLRITKKGTGLHIQTSTDRSDRRGAQFREPIPEEQAASSERGPLTTDRGSDAAESARKRENLLKLQNRLSKDSEITKLKINKEEMSKRQRELRVLLANKPVSFFDPNASKKLQENMDKLSGACEPELQKTFMNYQGREQDSPSQSNFPLQNLVSTVTMVMETTKKQSRSSATDEGMTEHDSQKLRRAIEVNQPQVIKDFVVATLGGVDLYDKDGYTLLCRAVHYGRSDIVELLLKAGADPNKQCRESEDTPLHIAVNFNFKKVQDLLLEHGAHETKLNKKGLLPWQGIQQQSQTSSHQK